jgi:uncharacterized membrane protein YgaE (UPF0421/DUF939 family)
VIKIGMRNIKTALSVFICLLFFEAINRDKALFACMAAVMCVQNTIEDSMKIGISRIIGTIIGGLSGALILYIVNTFFDDRILIIIIPLGIMILIKLCVTIKMKQAVSIYCIEFIGFFHIHTPSDTSSSPKNSRSSWGWANIKANSYLPMPSGPSNK